MAFGGGVSYEALRQMTPRELDAIMRGLREYRDEERRAAQQAVGAHTGQQSIGGDPIHNP